MQSPIFQILLLLLVCVYFDQIAKQCPNAIHLTAGCGFGSLGGDGCKEFFMLLLQAGADVNYVSSLPFCKNASLIHHESVLTEPTLLKELEKYKFDFDKFINFQDSVGKTSFVAV